MSKEKQISEIAQDLCNSTMCDLESYDGCMPRIGNCGRCQRVAEDLYNAGYRKQSEVEKWKEINEQLYKEMSERILEERKIERKLVAREIKGLQCEINRLKKYDEERDITLHARLISEAKAEVAKSIFEDIEICLASTHSIQMNKNAESYEYYEGYLRELIQKLKGKYI